jgi:muramidase (phage lysozyme)
VAKGKTKIEVQIPVERQKAAQAAGTYELADLPGELQKPSAAIRVAKSPKQDKTLRGQVRSLNSLTKLKAGQVLVNFGRSESRWASAYQKRRAGNASFMELLS